MALLVSKVKRDICFFLDHVGAASTQDIGEAVNSAGTDKSIYMLLSRMVRADWLEKDEDGRYRTTGRHRLYGFDNHTDTENRIRAVLLRKSGPEFTGRIYDTIYGPRNWGDWSDAQREGTHLLFHKTLRESSWFVRVGEGLWDLAPFARDPWTLLTG
jgi:hypothetical protein